MDSMEPLMMQDVDDVGLGHEGQACHAFRCGHRASISCTFAFTIALTNAAGSGFSGVNWMVPLLVLKPASASFSPGGTGPYKAQCFVAAPMYSTGCPWYLKAGMP